MLEYTCQESVRLCPAACEWRSQYCCQGVLRVLICFSRVLPSRMFTVPETHRRLPDPSTYIGHHRLEATEHSIPIWNQDNPIQASGVIPTEIDPMSGCGLTFDPARFSRLAPSQIQMQPPALGDRTTEVHWVESGGSHHEDGIW